MNTTHLMREKLKMKSKGYTLIEMMVVLFLMGLLSAVAVPSWISFWQRQQIRIAASQLYSALHSAKSESRKNLVRYAVTVCYHFSGFGQNEWIKYSVHPYSNHPSRFSTIKNISLVKSTVRRSPKEYKLSILDYGDCYTSHLGLFPGEGYALGFFYLSQENSKHIYRVGFNTLIGNIASCPVVSLQKTECQ